MLIWLKKLQQVDLKKKRKRKKHHKQKLRLLVKNRCKMSQTHISSAV